MGPHCAAQPDLEFLDCSNSPTTTSKVAETGRVHRYAWLGVTCFSRAVWRSTKAEGPGGEQWRGARGLPDPEEAADKWRGESRRGRNAVIHLTSSLFIVDK